MNRQGFTQITSKKDREILVTPIGQVPIEELKKEKKLILRTIICMLVKIQKDPNILAIAANQIGIRIPLFVSRIPLLESSLLPMTNEWSSKGVPKLVDKPEAFLLPSYIAPMSGILRCPETCLSHHSAAKCVENVIRYTTIGFTAFKVDFSSGNPDDLELEEVKWALQGLGAQVAQHEVDHLFGKGIWNYEDEAKRGGLF